MTVNQFLTVVLLMILGLFGLILFGNVVIDMYFKAKLDFVGKMAKGIGEALSKANELKQLLKKEETK